jgi:hypothetical protein
MILTLVECQPSKTDAGLDVLRRIFNSDLSAEDSIAAAPLRYTADSAIGYAATYGITLPVLYDGMFLMDTQARETGAKSCEIDFIFNGSLHGDLPAGKHSIQNTRQTAQAKTPFGPVSISISVPTSIYTWLSTEQGLGALALPPGSTGAPAGAAIITGTLTWVHGSDLVGGSGTSYASQIHVGDYVTIYTGPGPGVPITPFTVTFWAGFVVAVTSDTQIQLDNVYTGTTGSSYAPSKTGTVIYPGNVGVTVESIRIGCGFTSLLGAIDPAKWGPLLVATYFQALPLPTAPDSEELVPGHYWKNVQRIGTSLLANSC